ncbi:GNAT family N-acetyltransferase [Marinomonas spartinae]|uniref:GNAT family N-acetyltransferase n=1 Tax=Marinomonas spartinae TaxID=1792290 RepID=UPI0018F120E4|nr:N-acetyltransferase [Marinomonas spartinae]MBJ7555170.1 GNAT family N-acetyltransferase [Marinomonas spartinae]
MIRRAEKSDCLNLAALSLQVWLNTYATEGIRKKISEYALSTFTESHFLKLLDQASCNILVYEEEDHLVGFVLVDVESRFNESSSAGYEVVTLYVSTHFQGQGIGKKLLKKIESLYGSPFWLSTWINNHGAIAFYKKLGFQIIGELNFNLEGELHSNHVLSYTGT